MQNNGRGSNAMQVRYGNTIIFALLGLFAILHFGFSGSDAGPKVTGTNFIGGAAYICMALAIVLAARPSFLEDAFGGLDKMYASHRALGVSAGLLVLVHFIGHPDGPPEGATASALTPSAPLGMVSMVLLVFSIALSLNRKLAYHRWRMPHRLMGFIFIAITGHMMTAPAGFFDRFAPSGLMLAVIGGLGIVAYGYNLFGFNKRKGHPYKISNIKSLPRATEISLTPEAAPLAYKAGQFAILKIKNRKLHEPHPFTLSSSPQEKDLRFTVKALGDWTRKVRDELKPGLQATVYGPFGRFDPEAAGTQQVWVAGGVGITPFISCLRAMEPGHDKNIQLVYAVRNRDEALFIGEIQSLAKKLGSIELTLLESDRGQLASLELLQQLPGKLASGKDYFLCGPAGLVKSLNKGLRKAGVKKSAIHREFFEFR